MTTKIDGGLWEEIDKRFTSAWNLNRVETGMTAGGVPDVNGCHPRSGEFWLELKAAEAWAVRIRPLQVGWATRRTRAGGRVYLLTRRRGTRVRSQDYDELWLHHGADIMAVCDGGLKAAQPLGMWTGGPHEWNWDQLRDLLIRNGYLYKHGFT